MRILLIAILVLFYCDVNGQDYTMAKLPKKANTVVVNMDFKEAGKFLIKNGYVIKNANKEFGQIVTEEKLHGNYLGMSTHGLTISVAMDNDTTAAFSGIVTVDDLKENARIHWAKTSIYWLGWKSLVSLFNGMPAMLERR